MITHAYLGPSITKVVHLCPPNLLQGGLLIAPVLCQSLCSIRGAVWGTGGDAKTIERRPMQDQTLGGAIFKKKNEQLRKATMSHTQTYLIPQAVQVNLPTVQTALPGVRQLRLRLRLCKCKCKERGGSNAWWCS